jgi:hypothetical protein
MPFFFYVIMAHTVALSTSPHPPFFMRKTLYDSIAHHHDSCVRGTRPTLLSSLYYSSPHCITCLLAYLLSHSFLRGGTRGFLKKGSELFGCRLCDWDACRWSPVSSSPPFLLPPPPRPRPPFSLSLLCLPPSLPTACGDINDIWSYTAALVQYMSHHQMYVALSS